MKKANNLPRKIALMIGAPVALMIVIGVVEYFQSARSIAALEEQLMRHLPANRSALTVGWLHEGIRGSVYHAWAGRADASPESGKQELATLKKKAAALQEGLKTLGDLKFGVEIQTSIDHTSTALAIYTDQAEKLLARELSSGNRDPKTQLADFEGSYAKLDKLISTLNEQIELKAYESGIEVKSMSKRFSVILALLGFGILSGALAGFINTRAITRHMDALLQDLTRGFERVGVNISRLMAESHQLKTGASNITSASQNLAQASSEQSSALQETSSAIEEMNAMIRRNVENSSQSTATASASFEVAAQGQRAIHELGQAMIEIDQSNTDILKQVLDSNRQISEIVRVIHEIGEKTKIIDDIVFQTKLLSFNASVEAARAGEHGKGFAVVAEEVGNLAQMSGDAAKEISEMLMSSTSRVEGIIADTKQRVEKLVTDGKAKVDTGSNLAKQCGGILDSIVKNAEAMSRMVSEIATASHEQSVGVSEIAKAMGQLDQATHENVATSQQTAASAEQILSQAGSLQGIVDHLHEATQEGDDIRQRISDFVMGGRASGAKTREISEREEGDGHEGLRPPSSPKSRGNIVPLRIASAAEGAAKRVGALRGKPQMKKVAGNEDVPLKSDPRFEEV